MTESSSSTATTIVSSPPPAADAPSFSSPLGNDLETQSMEQSPILDNQSEEKSLSSLDTNINPSSNVSQSLSCNRIITVLVEIR